MTYAPSKDSDQPTYVQVLENGPNPGGVHTRFQTNTVCPFQLLCTHVSIVNCEVQSRIQKYPTIAIFYTAHPTM